MGFWRTDMDIDGGLHDIHRDHNIFIQPPLRPLYLWMISARVSLRHLVCAGALGLCLAATSAKIADAAQPNSGDEILCQSAINIAERDARLPGRLLGAIGLVESGRLIPATGRYMSWPWTINVAGTGYFYATKALAIQATQVALAAGIQSIDVGCMQINLKHHPHAFPSLAEAFDPHENATYAAGFLTQLFAQTHSWPQATAAYHSQTAEIGIVYARRVMAIWPLSIRYGGAAYLATPAASANKPHNSDNTPDPYHVLTPEFRAQLARNAAADLAQRVAMGVLPARPTPTPPHKRLRTATQPTRHPISPNS